MREQNEGQLSVYEGQGRAYLLPVGLSAPHNEPLKKKKEVLKLLKIKQQ